MKTVELVPAWSWSCEECGVQQFASSVVAEFLNDEEKLSYAKRFGIVGEFAESFESDGVVDFLTLPKCVKCYACGETFATIDMHGEST